MNLYGRQGDLVIEKLDKPIEGDLVKQKNIVFAGDSSGHRHRLMGDAMVLALAGSTRRFQIKKATELVHEKPDGHHTLTLEAGSYEIRPLRERGNGSDRAVED